MKLTPKQEKFAQLYVELGDASEAYRQSYDAARMKPATVHRKAKEQLDNGKITARIDQLQGALAERHKITVDTLLKELEENRQAALQAETVQAAAATAATMGKAKLLGLDKQILDLRSGDGSMTPAAQPLDVSRLSDNALAELMAARNAVK